MQLRSLVLFSAAVVSALVSSASAFTAATTKPAYYCETDDECDAKFPGTVCISVDNYGVVTSKCTPNTDSRPACRGAQPGLCPSYQSEEISYLNVHCVFVEVDASGKDVVDLTTSKTSTTSSSGSGSGTSKNATATRGRYLLLAATNKTTTAPPKGSTDGSKTAEVVVTSSSGSKSTAPVISTGKYAKVTIGKQSITGEFKCVDVSDCANQAYDPTTCDVEACGSPNSKMQCNNHGTCTYKSVQKMSKRSCMCYAGYGGDKCQQEVSNECDVDCGTGGDCVDGVCKCKKGFDGKAYKGKQGKANQRCTKCTNDLACQNDNACDISTGVCVCGPGFNGPTCGATEDSCTKRDCGTLGSCRVFNNGSSACYCNLCAPDCNLCPTKDCSTCPSLASTIFTSKAVLFVSAIVTLLLGNLAL